MIRTLLLTAGVLMSALSTTAPVHAEGRGTPSFVIQDHGIRIDQHDGQRRLPFQVEPVPGITLACPDPIAQEISFRLARRYNETVGMVHVVGTVRNNGGDYRSGRNQQLIQLLEDGQVIEQRPFTNLGSGESISVSRYIQWHTTNEFPPTYKIAIVYAPDISVDGNMANDDCRLTNNTRQRSGQDINNLF